MRKLNLVFMNRPYKETLAYRLGVSVHCSPLMMKVERLFRRYPSPGAVCLEDWLVDAANSRGATVVRRLDHVNAALPSQTELSDEELVTAICMPQCADRPQMLRLAAQLISRGKVSSSMLSHLARCERTEIVLVALARAALRVDPNHGIWSAIAKAFDRDLRLRDAILHWTRLAEPIPGPNGLCGSEWRLVA